jgi:hypothetical protein
VWRLHHATLLPLVGFVASTTLYTSSKNSRRTATYVQQNDSKGAVRRLVMQFRRLAVCCGVGLLDALSGRKNARKMLHCSTTHSYCLQPRQFTEGRNWQVHNIRAPLR